MHPEICKGIAEVGRLITEHWRSVSVAQRDRNLQLYLAQAKSQSERLRATGLLSTGVIRLRRAHQMGTAHGRRRPA